MSIHDTGRMIEEVLGDHPSVEEWRALRHSTEIRLTSLRRQKQSLAQEENNKDHLFSLEIQIIALDRQLAALETEEAIAHCVQETLNMIRQR